MRIRRAVLIGLLLGHSLGLVSIPATVVALGDTVLISEVQMGGAGTGHAGDEFIELYNPSAEAVSLNNWLVQYRAASAGSDCSKSWSTKATLTGVIPNHGYYLLAATSYMAADASFTAGLSQSAGAIRVVNEGSLAVDALAWGQGASCGHGAPAATILAGQSLERRPGMDQPLGGNGDNTGDNSADFIVRSVPEPQLSTSPIEDPADEVITPEPTVAAYLPLQINELLIDPVSPQTDDHDEFVELINPNNEAVDTNGYQLKWGSHVYHLAHQVIAAGEMITLTSAETPLSLTNSGGSLELLDPLGQSQGEPVVWAAAVAGATWARGADGIWDWTTTPTPGQANIMTDPVGAGAPGVTTNTGAGGAYLPVVITELVPDPEAPLTDADDEYVELYNPNPEPVNLSGYVIKTGASLGNSSVLGDIILASGQYLAITSGTSSLTLANGGSQVQVFDPAGAAASANVTYDNAKAGQAFALTSDGWRWTTTPTPNSANIMTESIATATATKTAAKTTKAAAKPKPKAAAKASAKPKAAKVAKPKVAKATKKKSTSQPLVAAAKTGGGQWLLIVLAGLTIAYIIYEFRHDIRNIFRFRRGHTSLRPPAGPVPALAPVPVAARPRINW